MDREAEERARAIVEEAKFARKHLPRWVWVVALAITGVCVVPFAYAWFAHGDAVPDQQATGAHPASSNGLVLGLVLGIGVGIVIGSVLAARDKR